jgi:phosphatidylserine/phosphatidylglycerophosphate/cardiolipin synthase-like enzyme
VIVGSSNLTSCGLEGNYEASTVLRSSDDKVATKINSYVQGLIKRGEVSAATQKMIDEYRREFDIKRIHQAEADTAAKAAMKRQDDDALIVIYEGPTPCPIQASCAVRFNEGFSCHVFFL